MGVMLHEHFIVLTCFIFCETTINKYQQINYIIL